MIGFTSWTIFNQLANYPAASDGNAPENASEDCVPTSLAMCIANLDNRLVSPDDLHDAVYGQGTLGGERELSYAALMKSRYGLTLGFDPKASGTTQITDGIRAYLARGIPCIVTMQSQWNALWGQATSGGYHVGVAWQIDDGAALHIANPWRGFDHVRPVGEWAARLGIGVWPVSKGATTMYGTKNADGTMSFAAGKLGAGMAALYVSSGEQGDLSIPETYYSDHESFARFTSGVVFRYDAHTGKSTIDTTGLTVDGLYSAWRALKDAPAPAPIIKEVVPADLTAAFKTMAHYAQQ